MKKKEDRKTFSSRTEDMEWTHGSQVGVGSIQGVNILEKTAEADPNISAVKKVLDGKIG